MEEALGADMGSIAWRAIAHADENAPVVGCVSTRTLPAGVWRRIMVSGKQLYIWQGCTEDWCVNVARRGLPAGRSQALNVQIGILLAVPPEEIILSNGRQLLWSDDILLGITEGLQIPDGGEANLLIGVSKSGIGERPMGGPGQPPPEFPMRPEHTSKRPRLG